MLDEGRLMNKQSHEKQREEMNIQLYLQYSTVSMSALCCMQCQAQQYVYMMVTVSHLLGSKAKYKKQLTFFEVTINVRLAKTFNYKLAK